MQCSLRVSARKRQHGRNISISGIRKWFKRSRSVTKDPTSPIVKKRSISVFSFLRAILNKNKDKLELEQCEIDSDQGTTMNYKWPIDTDSEDLNADEAEVKVDEAEGDEEMNEAQYDVGNASISGPKSDSTMLEDTAGMASDSTNMVKDEFEIVRLLEVAPSLSLQSTGPSLPQLELVGSEWDVQECESFDLISKSAGLKKRVADVKSADDIKAWSSTDSNSFDGMLSSVTADSVTKSGTESGSESIEISSSVISSATLASTNLDSETINGNVEMAYPVVPVNKKLVTLKSSKGSAVTAASFMGTCQSFGMSPGTEKTSGISKHTCLDLQNSKTDAVMKFTCQES